MNTIVFTICRDSVSFLIIHVIFCSKSLSESRLIISVIEDCVSVFVSVICGFVSFLKLGKSAFVNKFCVLFVQAGLVICVGTVRCSDGAMEA